MDTLCISTAKPLQDIQLPLLRQNHSRIIHDMWSSTGATNTPTDDKQSQPSQWVSCLEASNTHWDYKEPPLFHGPFAVSRHRIGLWLLVSKGIGSPVHWGAIGQAVSLDGWRVWPIATTALVLWCLVCLLLVWGNDHIVLQVVPSLHHPTTLYILKDKHSLK